MSVLDIYLAVPDEPGWAPVRNMVYLMSEYVSADIIEVAVNKSLKKSTKIISQFPKIKRGNKKALVIAYDPGQLYAISQPEYFFKKYGNIYGWVIDSFWTERIPKFLSRNKVYDGIFVTDPSDRQDFEYFGISDVNTLLWGSDVWSNKELVLKTEKSNDLLRVGRQPSAWDDDAYTKSIAEREGISFEGRPSFGDTLEESQENLKIALLRSKYVLAFSNRVSPTKYTHPSKEYITGRWVDALSLGCTVVGAKPNSQATEKLLWEGATLEISSEDVHNGIKSIKENNFSVLSKEERYKLALENLDWRFRFLSLFSTIGINSYKLKKELLEIEEYLYERS